MTGIYVINVSLTLGRRRRGPGESVSPFYDKIGVVQKQSVVGTNLDETMCVFYAIGWGRKSSSVALFLLCKVAKLGVKIAGNDHSVRWTLTSK